MTKGYRLPVAHVIHAVGPVWKGGSHGEDDLLASCYRKALGLARDHGLRSIAFPAISCGIYGFPAQRAGDIAMRTVGEELPTCPALERVLFAMRDARVEDAFRRSLSAC
jgi:O-acetyl-ADP-ribose deacetylase (regulator of RNase III)